MIIALDVPLNCIIINISCTPDKDIRFSKGFVRVEILIYFWLHVFLFNIGCKDMFHFKTVDAIASLFSVNVMKIEFRRIKACKKKNLSCE